MEQILHQIQRTEYINAFDFYSTIMSNTQALHRMLQLESTSLKGLRLKTYRSAFFSSDNDHSRKAFLVLMLLKK